VTPTDATTVRLDPMTMEERDFRWRVAVESRLAAMDLHRLESASDVGAVSEVDFGDILITDWTCPSVEGIRRPGNVRDDDDALVLLTASSGSQIIDYARETMVLRPGTLLIMSTRATGRFVIPNSLVKRTLKVPMSALDPFDIARPLPRFLLMEIAHHPLARLLHDYLDSVSDEVARLTPAQVEPSRNALLTLLAGVIRTSRPPDIQSSDFLTPLRRQLETWIVDHLRTGPIRIGDLARACSVAPRTVQRAFEATGETMGAVVRQHRIAAARSDLVATDLPIAAIAHRWGFCDASHFGREFRRQMSMSPGDYRQDRALSTGDHST
jgi:AraC family transcriptional regulator, positive regulator of tynA and feaB